MIMYFNIYLTVQTKRGTMMYTFTCFSCSPFGKFDIFVDTKQHSRKLIYREVYFVSLKSTS